jgi:hypothetical protein
MPDPISSLREAVEQMRWAATSDDGYINVWRDDTRRIRVRVDAGTVAALSAEELEAEIRSALLAALAAYDRAYFDARRTAYGPGLGLTNLGGR